MRWVVLSLIGLAAISLVVGYVVHGLVGLAVAVVVVGVLWGLGQWRGLDWPGGVGLFLFAAVAAYGVLQGQAIFWLLGGLVLALLAWDLAGFQRRLEAGPEVRQATRLMQVHLLRLSLLVITGLILSRVAFGLRLDLNYLWAIGLGLAGVYGLSRAVRFARRGSD